MDTSNPETPITLADSQGDDILRPESTVPSSPVPVTESVGGAGMKSSSEERDGNANVGLEGEMEMETEGMDTKAKALMHLLKTSSVCAS